MVTFMMIEPPAGIVIEDIPWSGYEAMLGIVGDRSIRINYDREKMEIMSPSLSRSRGTVSYLIGLMVDTLTNELDITFEPADLVTYRREDREKGIEADKSYHLRENAAKVCGNRESELAIDPPPDLIIDLYVTSSSIPRLPIFAALGIPEIWRVEGEELLFLHLQIDGTYQSRDHSRAFPTFPVADASRFLEQGQSEVKNTWIRGFRAYVREVLVPLQGRPDDARCR